MSLLTFNVLVFYYYCVMNLFEDRNFVDTFYGIVQQNLTILEIISRIFNFIICIGWFDIHSLDLMQIILCTETLSRDSISRV